MTLAESSRLPAAYIVQATDTPGDVALAIEHMTAYVSAQNAPSIREKGGEVYLETGK